jgi:hypothetical protein
MPEVTIDEIWEDPKGDVVLVLRQPDPWTDAEVLTRFQDRLNGYIETVKHKRLLKMYPDFDGKPFRIRVMCLEGPSQRIGKVFDRIFSDLQGLGIGFEVISIDVQKRKPKGDLKDLFRKVFSSPRAVR